MVNNPESSEDEDGPLEARQIGQVVDFGALEGQEISLALQLIVVFHTLERESTRISRSLCHYLCGIMFVLLNHRRIPMSLPS